MCVCAKKNLVFVQSSGSETNKVAQIEPHNTIQANKQQGAFVLVCKTGEGEGRWRRDGGKGGSRSKRDGKSGIC